ncbi:hypothetical protein PG985_009821 [Apiospora marii]|uniref:uncharacterized protein n=1 Tax=Apiospora marii TaxID=335849 RepID=UPI003130B392
MHQEDLAQVYLPPTQISTLTTTVTMYLPQPQTTIQQRDGGKTHREPALQLALQLLIVLLIVSLGLYLAYIAFERLCPSNDPGYRLPSVLGRRSKYEKLPPLHATEEGPYRSPVPATPYPNRPPRRQRPNLSAELDEEESEPETVTGFTRYSRDLVSA